MSMLMLPHFSGFDSFLSLSMVWGYVKVEMGA